MKCFLETCLSLVIHMYIQKSQALSLKIITMFQLLNIYKRKKNYALKDSITRTHFNLTLTKLQHKVAQKHAYISINCPPVCKHIYTVPGQQLKSDIYA